MPSGGFGIIRVSVVSFMRSEWRQAFDLFICQLCQFGVETPGISFDNLILALQYDGKFYIRGKLNPPPSDPPDFKSFKRKSILTVNNDPKEVEIGFYRFLVQYSVKVLKVVTKSRTLLIWKEGDRIGVACDE